MNNFLVSVVYPTGVNANLSWIFLASMGPFQLKKS